MYIYVYIYIYIYLYHQLKEFLTDKEIFLVSTIRNLWFNYGHVHGIIHNVIVTSLALAPTPAEI